MSSLPQYSEGDIYDINGTVYHVHIDPNGQYTNADGTKYSLVEGFVPKPDQSKIPPSTDNPTLYHGPVADAPPVPGGSDPTKKPDVTLVNTDAMKTFAKNLDGLIADGSPLLQARDSLEQVNVKAGGFRSAVTLANEVSGGGSNLRDATRLTLQNTIDAIADLVDGLNRAASHYDNAEDLNNMNSQDFSTYLGQAGGQINAISGNNNSSGPAS